jgi:hypothetical protein
VPDMEATRAKLNRLRLQNRMFACTVTLSLSHARICFCLLWCKRRPSLSGASADNSKKRRLEFENDTDVLILEGVPLLAWMKRIDVLADDVLPEIFYFYVGASPDRPDPSKPDKTRILMNQRLP